MSGYIARPELKSLPVTKLVKEREYAFLEIMASSCARCDGANFINVGLYTSKTDRYYMICKI